MIKANWWEYYGVNADTELWCIANHGLIAHNADSNLINGYVSLEERGELNP